MSIRTTNFDRQDMSYQAINNMPHRTVDFSQIQVGLKTLQDATINLNVYGKINSKWGNKEEVLKAISRCDYAAMREISDFFFKTSGIYSRLCRYMANIYRWDWKVTPFSFSNGHTDIDAEVSKKELNKTLEGYYKVLTYLDKFGAKKFCGEVALKVVRYGCYYGYIIPQNGTVTIQELPTSYCRSRFKVNGRPVVEFNMSYFDNQFATTEERLKILKLFPKEFQKGYALYKKGKLPPAFIGDNSGWYLLDVNNAIKFNINDEDFPLLISVIPAIIDLDEALALDKKKMQQQLLKIIIQKMPLDKNGEMVFDVEESKDFHNAAVRMLGKAVGLDVLTTYADTEVASLADNTTINSSTSSVKVAKDAVFDQAGISQMQFNTDGNIALEKSTLNDEATMYNLLLQFEAFLNYLLTPFNVKPKKVYYQVQMLTTTIYNYKDMAKLYKEQTQLGASKFLPQIALGQAQSAILADAYFENDGLDLINVFIPPLMSSTMNADILNRKNNGANGSNSTGEKGDGEGAGRKPLEDDQKSEKTIRNLESKG